MVRYHSLRTDLIMAQETCEALAELLAAKSMDPHSVITEAALLSSVIVLYARATSTGSTERAPFSLEPYFNDDQKIVHRELIDLRNDAIAHYGSGGSYADQAMWKAEVGILQFESPNSRVGVVTRRTSIDQQLAERATVQIDFALTIINRVYDQKTDLVLTEIDRISKQDTEFYKEIAEHPFNLDVFLASKEAGDRARAAADHGYASGVSSHR